MAQIVVGVESGSRQLIGMIETHPDPGPVVLQAPLMLIEQRTSPTQTTIALLPLLQSYQVDVIHVNLSSVIAIDEDSELAKRYQSEWESVNMRQRAARAGILPATSLPGGKNGSGPLITT